MTNSGRGIARCAIVRTQLWIVTAVLMAIGCANRSADRQLADDLDPATSWIATLELSCDAWLANRAPASFVHSAIAPARKALTAAQSAMDRTGAAPRLRQTAAAEIRVATDAALELDRAVGRHDRAAVVRLRSRLAAAYAALHEIERKAT